MIFLWPIALVGLLFVPVIAILYWRWSAKRTNRVEATLGDGYTEVAQ